MRYGLSPAVIADFYHVFAQYPEIERVLLFGSRAKNTYKPGSDIDLAVLSASLTDTRFSQLWNQIDALPLLFKIDLLHWDRLQQVELKAKIDQEGVVFFDPLVGQN